ncbi:MULTISPECIES: peroxiredoxin [Nitratireductor]|uniref:Glutathione-dependent peroxiredoxin n=1 Tax=Nitratireductor thuwali TaxID=2267699 RepID=A0ABY5MN31_9HYPH|nr:peroxiredoxin [Nitratireductor luteus]UUP18798.1 Putative peroxiredoxin [Nitratireductor thuwali]
MPISVGDRLPDVKLKKASPNGAEEIGVADFFAGRRIVLFGVPGAFTPTCSNDHLPGFVENFDAITARGIDAIAVVSVNDAHVMGAWARFTGAEDRLVFLADGNGTFARALGLDADLSDRGLGQRSRRFSMIVEDGVVKKLNLEEVPGKAVTSGAARILDQL